MLQTLVPATKNTIIIYFITNYQSNQPQNSIWHVLEVQSKVYLNSTHTHIHTHILKSNKGHQETEKDCAFELFELTGVKGLAVGQGREDGGESGGGEVVHQDGGGRHRSGSCRCHSLAEKPFTFNKWVLELSQFCVIPRSFLFLSLRIEWISGFCCEIWDWIS